MRFGKRTLFLVFNSFTGLILLVYMGVWLNGRVVTGTIVGTSLNATVMRVRYRADDTTITASFMRHGVPLAERRTEVRYLPWNPERARINSFLDLWAEPLGWWGLFLLASTVLLLTNNSVFARGTVFQLHKGFPWISMEEYFPDAGAPQGQHTRRPGPRPPRPPELNE